GEDELWLEVDIGDDGDLAFGGDRGQRVGVFLAWARYSDDVAAGGGQLGDLLQGRVDVVGLGGAHGLHRNRIVAAHPDIADHQLSRLAPWRQRRRRGRRHTQTCGHGLPSLPFDYCEPSLQAYWNSRIGLTTSAVTVNSM